MRGNKVKKGKRLYVNITNKCNVECPFCCMYSSPRNNRFMSFDTFKHIVDETDGSFELQLEGGEPLLHKNLFLEYAVSTNRCTKIILLTNGILLEEHINRLIDFSSWNQILLEIKVSINYFLIEKNENHIKKMADLAFATKYIPSIDMVFNVRKRNEKDEDIETELKHYGILEQSNVFYLQSYGKLKDSEEYEKPIIVQNIEDWSLYASDGKCFGQDLIARSEHEHIEI